MVDTNGSDVTNSKPQKGQVYLNNKDLMELNYHTEKLRSYEKDETIVKLKLELLKVQEALLGAQLETIKRDRMLIDYQTGLNRDRQSVAKDKSKEALDHITSQHDLLTGEKWGYNPETGEIIINEEQ